MILYSAVIPSYSRKGENGGGSGSDDEVINAEDPTNRDKVRQFFEQSD